MNKHFASSDMEEQSQTNEMSLPESGKLQQQPKRNQLENPIFIPDHQSFRNTPGPDFGSTEPNLISFKFETTLGLSNYLKSLLLKIPVFTKIKFNLKARKMLKPEPSKSFSLY